MSTPNIRRERLTTALGDPDRVQWFVEAGAGFGKSIALDQLRSSLLQAVVVLRKPIGEADLASFLNEFADAARRLGHLDLAAELGGSSGNTTTIADALAASDYALAIDDVDNWDIEVGEFIADLVRAANAGFRIVLAGRSVPPALEALRSKNEWSFLDGSDCAFTLDETAEVLEEIGVDPSMADLLHDVSDGWPLAVSAAAAKMSETTDPAQIAQELGRHESLVDGLLHSYLDALEPSDTEALAFLAKLPFFDDKIAASVGSDGLIRRANIAGIPITKRSNGWSEISGQFRSALLRQDSPQQLTDDILQRFIARGEIPAAITTCLALGETGRAATTIAGLSNDQQTLLEPTTLNAAMTAIGKDVAVAPRCLLVQAQVNASFGRMPEGFGAIQRSVELFADNDPNWHDPQRIEASLELALWEALSGDFGAARIRLDDTVEHFSDQPAPMLVAKAHDVRGLVLQESGGVDALEAASQEFTNALTIWRQLAEPRPAAVTVFRLAAGVLGDLGQWSEALELLDGLSSVGPMTLVNRARVGLERSILLPYLGRAREVPQVVGEARRIGSLLGHDWLVAWTYWTEIVAVSFGYDGDEVVRLLDEFEETGFIVMNEFTQAAMWAEVTEALARCENFERAEDTVVRAVQNYPEQFWHIRYGECSLAARAKDPNEALDALDELAMAEDAEPSRLWSVDLLRAYCHWRLGDQAECTKWMASAFDHAREIGQASLPDIVEGRLVAAMQSENPSPLPSRFGAFVEISMFDDFEIQVNGAPVDMPKGRVSNLVKLMVLGQGRLLVDQVVDPLWPDTDLPTGRKRLRNVLNRVREVCGDIIERDGDELVLADNVASDYQRAIDRVGEALGPSATVTSAADAIEAIDRALLPGDRYSDWAEEARREMRSKLVRLLDSQAALAEQIGDLDLTVAALQRADELDELRSDRRHTAARLLRAAGRDAAAAAIST